MWERPCPEPGLLTASLSLVSPRPLWTHFSPPSSLLGEEARQKEEREMAKITVRQSPSRTEPSDSCLQPPPLVQGLQEVPVG